MSPCQPQSAPRARPRRRAPRLVAVSLALASLTLTGTGFSQPAAPATKPAAAALPAAQEVRLTPRDAVQLALRQNLGLRVDRLDAALTDLAERVAAAAYDTTVFGSADLGGAAGEGASSDRLGLTSVGANVGLRKELVTGTRLEGSLFTGSSFGARGGADPTHQSGLELAAHQALLEGRSREVNEAEILTARLQREAALALLRRRAELVAVDALHAYWDLRAAVSELEVQKIGVQMAEATLHQTEELIAAGKLPASEKASADYTVKQRQRGQLRAQQTLDDTRDRIARILGIVAPESSETPTVVPVSSPRRSRPRSTRADLQRMALEQRGDYLALKIEARIRELELRSAEDRTQPRLDLSAGLRLAGLGGSDDAEGSSVDGANGGYWASYATDRVSWSTGLTLEVPLGNAEAEARQEMAALRARQIEASLAEAVQELSLQLNLARRATRSAYQELKLTEEAAAVAEAKLATETERYAAGRVTAHILSTVQAETMAERLAREQALAALVKAAVTMRASAGGLLQSMGLKLDEEARVVAAPGEEAAEIEEEEAPAEAAPRAREPAAADGAAGAGSDETRPSPEAREGRR